MTEFRAVLLAFMALAVYPVPSPAEPPPWAPAHGWRKKNDPNYIGYTVLTTDGQVLNGILASETATSITIKQIEGKSTTLLRNDIEEIRSTGVSLMPEGLEKNVSPQQMADLIAFLKQWRYREGKPTHAAK